MNTRAVSALLGMVADAGSAESVDAFRAALLAALAHVFPCDVLVFNEFQIRAASAASRSPVVTCTASPPLQPRGAVPPAIITAFLPHLTAHPLVRLHAAGDCHAYRLSDTTSVRGLRRAPLHGEFLRPAALEHQLTISLEGPPGRLTSIWVNRSRRDFSVEDVVLAELLRPWVQAGEQAARRAAARAALTPREREVIDLVATGASNAAIAEALVVSPGTVKKHLDNIYAELGVRTRAAAAQHARAAPPARR